MAAFSTDPRVAEKGVAEKGMSKSSDSILSTVRVGQENLSDSLPPHESYEGVHRWDPSATWTAKEEAAVVRKTDLYLLTWICLMVSAPPIVVS